MKPLLYMLASLVLSVIVFWYVGTTLWNQATYTSCISTWSPITMRADMLIPTTLLILAITGIAFLTYRAGKYHNVENSPTYYDDKLGLLQPSKK